MPMKNKDRLRLQNLLNVIGTAAEAAFDLLNEDETEAECEHPKDKRKDYSTMGVTRWKCELCGYYFDGAEKVVSDGDAHC